MKHSMFLFGRQLDLTMNRHDNTAGNTIPQTSHGIISDASANQNARNDNGKIKPVFIFGTNSNSLGNNNKPNDKIIKESVPQTSNGIISESSVNKNALIDSGKVKPVFIFGTNSDSQGNKNKQNDKIIEESVSQTWNGNISESSVNKNALIDNGKLKPVFIFGTNSDSLGNNNKQNDKTKEESVSQTWNGIISESSVNKNALIDNGKLKPVFIFGTNSDLLGNNNKQNDKTKEESVSQTWNGIISESSVNKNALIDNGKVKPVFIFGTNSDSLGNNNKQNDKTKEESVSQTWNGIFSESSVNKNALIDNGKLKPVFIFGTNSDSLGNNNKQNDKTKEESVSQTWNGIISESSVNKNALIDNGKVKPVFSFGTNSDSLGNNNKQNDKTKEESVSQTWNGIISESSVNKNALIDNGKVKQVLIFGTKSDSLGNNNKQNDKIIDKSVRPPNGLGTRLHSATDVNEQSNNSVGKTGPESNVEKNTVQNVKHEEATVFQSFGIKLDLKENNNELKCNNENKGDIQNETSKLRVKTIAEEKKTAGDVHFKSQNYVESLAKYDEAVKLCPKNPSYLCKRSDTLLMLERYEEALKDAQKATELDSTFPDGYICKAKSCLILGKLSMGENAVRCASELGADMKIIQSDYKTCNEKYKAGLWAMESGYYLLAITKMEDCLILSPGCLRFKLKKAECLAMVGRYSEAERIALTRLEIKDSDQDANYVLGLCYYFQKEIEQAFTIFTMLINDFNNKKAADIYKKAKRLEEITVKGDGAVVSMSWKSALDYYNEALAIDEYNTLANAILYFKIASIYEQTNRLEEAVKAYTSSLKLDNNYSQALHNRGRCYMEMGRHTGAVRDYERLCQIDNSTENRRLLQKANALKNNSEMAEEMKERGNEYCKKKEFDKALKMYDEAVRLCPANHYYLSNRSATLMQLERYREALADSEKAVGLDETFTKGYIRIAKCCVVLGELAVGEFAIRRATELGGGAYVKDEQNVFRNLRRLQKDTQDAMKDNLFLRAIEFVDRFLEDSPFCSEVQLNKAECLAMLGRCQEAEELALSVDVNANKNYVLGLCRYFEEHYDSAFDLLKLAPDQTKAMDLIKKAKMLRETSRKGNVAYNSKDWRTAINFYTEGLSIDNNNRKVNVKLYFYKAVAQKNLNLLKEAIQSFTGAIELNKRSKTDMSAYKQRGDCYMQLKEYEEAVLDYEAVYMIDESKTNLELLEKATSELKLKRKDYHYWVLGITKTASQNDIKRAYRKCALSDHPDKNPHASPAEILALQRRFHIKTTAFKILSDPQAKERYDRQIYK